MKTVKAINYQFLILLILPALGVAQVPIWTGNMSTEWNEQGNWNTGTIPLTTDSVVIAGNRPNYPVLISDVQIRSLRLQSGSSLTLNGHSLSLSHNLIEDNSYLGLVCLVMNDTADVLIVHRNCTLGSRNSFTNGTVYIKGNLTQNAVANALQSEGTRFVFNGLAEQSVSFSLPNDTYFEDIVLSSGSIVRFNSDVRIQGWLTMEENSRLTQAGSSLETYYASQMPQIASTAVYDVNKTYIAGDIVLAEDCSLPLSTNHLFLTGGSHRSITFNHHRLSVGGDVSVLTDYSVEKHLVMLHSDDFLEVGGNLNVSGANSFSDGVVMVKGNITHGAVAAALQSQHTRFVMNGISAQTITMYPDGYLNDLELASGVQVNLLSNAEIRGLLLMMENSVINQSNSNRVNFTNKLPRLLNGAEYNVYYTYIMGNIVLDEDCELINPISNLIIPSGENRSLRLNGHTLTIGAQLDVQSDYSSWMHVIMDEPGDHFIIRGNAEFGGGNIFQDGTIELGGNLLQKGNSYALQPSGTRFILNGNGNQEINIQSSAYNQSFLNDLVIENSNTILLNNHLYIIGKLIASGQPSVIASVGRRLQCKGLDVSELTFDNTLLILDSNLLTRFDNVTFRNYNPSANQWVINCRQMEDTARNLRFLSTPTTGKYIVGNDQDGGGTSSRLLVIDAIPTYGLDKTATSGGFVIQWMNSPIAVTDEVMINEDEAALIDVLANDSDPDGDEIIVDDIVQPLHGICSIMDRQLHYVPIVNYFGVDSFYYRLKDTFGLFNWGKSIVTISAVNDAPFVAETIPDVGFTEDFGRLFVASLNEVFSDVDNMDLSYGITISGSGITADISYDSLYINSTLNFNGQIEFYVSASDGEFIACDTFLVNVMSVNDPPVIANPISDITYPENFGRVFVANLNDVFNDVDDTVLTFGEATSGAGVTADISNDSLYINSTLYFNGSIDIYVSALDCASTVYDTFTVIVTAVNNPPMSFTLLLPANGDTICQQSVPLVFTWHAPVDPDGDTLSYDLYITGPSLDTVITGVTDTTLSYSDISRFKSNSFYFWWVVVNNDVFTISSTDTFAFYYPALVSVNKDNISLRFTLYQNYPNPFNPNTTITFDLPVSAHIVLKVYNILGQEVRGLIDSKLNPGKHEIVWDGRNDNAQIVATGIYFYKIQAGQYKSTKKMIYVR